MGQILCPTYQLLNLGSSDQICSSLAQSLIQGTGHTKPLIRRQGCIFSQLPRQGCIFFKNLSVQHKRGQGIVLSTVIPQPCPSQHINQGRSAQDDHRAAGLLPAGQVHAHAGGLLHLGGTGTQRQAVQGPKAAEKTRETRVYFGYLYFDPKAKVRRNISCVLEVWLECYLDPWMMALIPLAIRDWEWSLSASER